jgi:hypothetical protein
VKISFYLLKEKKEKPIQYYHCNGLGHTRLNYPILHVILVTQTFKVLSMFNLLNLSGEGYTRGKGFSRGQITEKEVTILGRVEEDWIEVIAI